MTQKEKKVKRLHIPVTETEKELLKAAAEKESLSLSSWVRSTLYNKVKETQRNETVR